MPTKVGLPEGVKTKGFVLADQIRTLQRPEHGFRYIETVPPEVLEQVRAIVGELPGITRR